MADSPTESFNLHDGVDLSSTVFASKRADVTYFVNAGGVAYLTTNGRRRMAMVPVPVGLAYEAARKATTNEDRAVAAMRLLEALGVEINIGPGGLRGGPTNSETVAEGIVTYDKAGTYELDALGGEAGSQGDVRA